MLKKRLPIKTKIAWLLKSQKTTITGCAVLLGTGIKWSMGAISPADVPEVIASLIEVSIGVGLIYAKDYDIKGSPHD